ncbi:MAG: hypothetical protein PUD59_01810 [bacterium]|nr:hypothetical protein [bacterium]
MNEKKSKNIIIIALCITLIFMGVGFSLLSQQLNINATATVTSTWNVHFDDATPIAIVDSTAADAGANQGKSTAATYDSNTAATVAFTLVKPGDFVEYTFKIDNTGSINAALSSFSATLNNDTYIERTATIGGSTLSYDADNGYGIYNGVNLNAAAATAAPAGTLKLANTSGTTNLVVRYTFKDVDSDTFANMTNSDNYADGAYTVTDTLILGFVQD